MLEEVKDRLERIRDGLAEMRGYLDVDRRKLELEKLEEEAAKPDFWDDQTRARSVIDKTNALRAVTGPYERVVGLLDDIAVFIELAEAEEDEGERQAATAEVQKQLKLVEKEFSALEMHSLLGGKVDARNAYLSLHAGAGGTESCDWADMLFRMYSRYAESHGFDLSVMDMQPGDEAGIKSVTFLVSGPFAYGYLKAERGVHRLVRISPFDANKRRHTSFAALDVIAEIEEDLEVEIAESDLRIDTFRASGAGGQHVNTTDSAVRITHVPTNIIVQCQAERSQHSNRNKAMKMLKARLYDYEMDKQRKEMEKFYGDKGDIAWGRQIRSYVMQPYTMVKDHRTNIEKGNVEAVMDGDLDEFIEGYLKKQQADEHSAANSGK
ncbi:MAG: peptide chain release factor 2 [Verrucomicrobia bacterium]|nr:peptide chain release factor 2 [Verrucomicrobiota bacterium]